MRTLANRVINLEKKSAVSTDPLIVIINCFSEPIIKAIWDDQIFLRNNSESVADFSARVAASVRQQPGLDFRVVKLSD